jgi:hypothetical protein
MLFVLKKNLKITKKGILMVIIPAFLFLTLKRKEIKSFSGDSRLNFVARY